MLTHQSLHRARAFDLHAQKYVFLPHLRQESFAAIRPANYGVCFRVPELRFYKKDVKQTLVMVSSLSVS